MEEKNISSENKPSKVNQFKNILKHPSDLKKKVFKRENISIFALIIILIIFGILLSVLTYKLVIQKPTSKSLYTARYYEAQKKAEELARNKRNISPPKTERLFTIYKLEDGIRKTIYEEKDVLADDPIMDSIGNIYFAKRIGNDKNIVYKFNVSSGKNEEFYRINEESSEETISRLQFKEPNLLYFNISNDRENNNLEFIELNTENNQQKIIIQKDDAIFSRFYYLDKIDNKYLVMYRGGDGCGGWGEVYLTDGNTEKSITKLGSGCLAKPNFIHYSEDKNQLTLINVLERDSESENDSYGYPYYYLDKLYSLNVLTNEIDEFYDFYPEREQIVSLRFDEATNAFWVVKKDELISINLDTKIATKVNYPKEIENLDYASRNIDDGTLYVSEYNNDVNSKRELINKYELDLFTGKLTKVDNSSSTSSSNQNYIGEYDGVKYYFSNTRQ